MAGFDTSTANLITKKVYQPNKILDLTNDSRVTLALLPKMEKFTGSSREVTFRYGFAQSVHSDFATAQTLAAAQANKYVRASIVGLSKQAPASISSDLIAQAGDDAGAYVRAITEAIDSAINNLSNRVAREILGTGWGDIGTIEAGSISGATLRLLNKADMVNVEEGQQHVFASTLSSSVLRGSGGTLTVASVDVDSRTITYTANVSTVSGVTDGDFVFNYGDRDNSATPAKKCLSGMQGWIPPVGSAPSSGDNWFGVDRSKNPTRLAGHRYDATGKSISEAMQTAAAVVAQDGGKLSHFIVHPDVYNTIALELGSRVRYEPISKGAIGFSSLMVQSPLGDVRILAERFQPVGSMMGVNMSDWQLFSSGPIVSINEDDGMKVLRDPNNDGLQARIVYRNAQLVCLNPKSQINVKLS